MTGFSEQLDATSEKYLAHFAKTATGLKEICGEIGIPLDASGVNAVAFTTYKATKDAFGHMPTKAAPAPDPTGSANQAKPSSGEKGRILKLENAGDEAYIAVAGVARVEGNFGPQYEFDGALQPSGETVRLFIGSAAVERQCEFLGMVPAGFVGQTVQFSRAPNPKGKPYWNIAVKKVAQKPSNDFTQPPRAQEDDSLPF